MVSSQNEHDAQWQEEYSRRLLHASSSTKNSVVKRRMEYRAAKLSAQAKEHRQHSPSSQQELSQPNNAYRGQEQRSTKTSKLTSPTSVDGFESAFSDSYKSDNAGEGQRSANCLGRVTRKTTTWTVPAGSNTSISMSNHNLLKNIPPGAKVKTTTWTVPGACTSISSKKVKKAKKSPVKSISKTYKGSFTKTPKGTLTKNSKASGKHLADYGNSQQDQNQRKPPQKKPLVSKKWLKLKRLSSSLRQVSIKEEENGMEVSRNEPTHVFDSSISDIESNESHDLGAQIDAAIVWDRSFSSQDDSSQDTRERQSDTKLLIPKFRWSVKGFTKKYANQVRHAQKSNAYGSLQDVEVHLQPDFTSTDDLGQEQEMGAEVLLVEKKNKSTTKGRRLFSNQRSATNGYKLHDEELDQEVKNRTENVASILDGQGVEEKVSLYYFAEDRHSKVGQSMIRSHRDSTGMRQSVRSKLPESVKSPFKGKSGRNRALLSDTVEV